MCILPISVFQGNGFSVGTVKIPVSYTVGDKDTFWNMNAYFLATFEGVFLNFSCDLSVKEGVALKINCMYNWGYYYLE